MTCVELLLNILTLCFVISLSFYGLHSQDKMKIIVYLCAFWCCVGWAKTFAQPSICQDDDQCSEGYYCERPPGFCRKCLSCVDLKRESKPLPTSCTKTIGDCGPCYPGLVNNPSGDLNAECVPASAAPPTASDSGPPSYIWAAIAVGAILMLLIVALVVYVLRKTDTKILASTRASFRAGCARADAAESPEPDAPPPPPPYRYEPVRPTSPPPPHHAAPLSEEEQPARAAAAVKLAQAARAHAAERERAARQAARVYSPPHYVRVRAPDPPPSYDSALSDDDVVLDMHDDNTMESAWTPDTSAVVPVDGSVTPAAPGSAAELSTLLSEARGTTVVRPPPTTPDQDTESTPNKVPCIRQDSNNNGNRRGASNGNASGGGEGSTPLGPVPPPGPPTALTFNITVQQHNDLKLIRT